MSSGQDSNTTFKRTSWIHDSIESVNKKYGKIVIKQSKESWESREEPRIVVVEGVISTSSLVSIFGMAGLVCAGKGTIAEWVILILFLPVMARLLMVELLIILSFISGHFFLQFLNADLESLQSLIDLLNAGGMRLALALTLLLLVDIVDPLLNLLNALLGVILDLLDFSTHNTIDEIL
jgi:hypothetical protein